MKKLYLLLNHTLTENQITELKETWHVDSIEETPDPIKNFWSQIKADRVITKKDLQLVVDWLNGAKEGDIIVLQGEFGSSFALVDYALQKKIVPVHSVTRRVASETRDGEKVFRNYVFEHVCFRKYDYYTNLKD